MKFWKRTIILNIILIVLVILIGIIHTEVILNGKITAEQDYAISHAYGQFVVYSSLALWIISSFISKFNKNK